MKKLKDVVFVLLCLVVVALVVHEVAKEKDRPPPPKVHTWGKGAGVVAEPYVFKPYVLKFDKFPSMPTTADAYRNLEREMEDRRIADLARKSDGGHREAQILVFLQVRDDIRRALREWERRGTKK